MKKIMNFKSASTDYYYPRTDLAHFVLRSAMRNDAMNLSLFKERRSGKTSFLLRDLQPTSIQCFEQYHVVVLYFSFMGIDEKDFSQLFVDKFFQTLSLFPFAKSKSFFNDLKKMSFKFEASINHNGVNISKDENVNFEELFLFFKQSFPDCKIILCFDEFQEIARFKNTFLASKLRTAIDTYSDVVKSIFTGSSYNALMSFFNDIKQPFYNFGGTLNFESFDRNFVTHICKAFFEFTQRPINEDEVYEAFLATNKSPYYVSQALKNLENNLNSTFKEQLKLLMVQDKSIIELDSVNRHFFNSLSAFEKAMVYQIVYLGGKPFGQESRQFLMAQFPDLSEQQIRNKIQYANKKIIKSERFIKQNGAITLIDLRFKEWFLNQPIESYLSNNLT